MNGLLQILSSQLSSQEFWRNCILSIFLSILANLMTPAASRALARIGSRYALLKTVEKLFFYCLYLFNFFLFLAVIDEGIFGSQLIKADPDFVLSVMTSLLALSGFLLGAMFSLRSPKKLTDWLIAISSWSIAIYFIHILFLFLRQ